MSGTLLRRIATGVVVVLILAAMLWIAARIPRTLSMFLIAAFIAFGASPLVRRLESRMPRPLAIASVYLILLGGLVLIALVVIPIAYVQIVALVGHADEYVAASQDAVQHLEGFVRARLGDRVAMPTFGQVQTEVGAQVGSLFHGTLASIGSILIGTFNALLVGVSALILSVFFLLQGREVRRGVLALVPHSRRHQSNALMLEVASIFGHFVAGQAALSAIVALAVWIVLVPSHFAFSLLVAVICGIGYAVPFFGMIVAQVIAAALALPQGSGMTIYVTLAIFVIARIADNVLVPKIMAESVGVSPIAVMFAVFAGGELFGIWGLILGIPAAALLRVLYEYFVLPWIVRTQHGEQVDVVAEVRTVADPVVEVVVVESRSA